MPTLEECETELALQPEVAYPDSPFFQGPNAPCRFEAEVYHCVVRGTIPKQIDGTYYRCMPDHHWAPAGDDIFINGDGCIDAIRIKDGHADFKQKFVRTEKFVVERAARQSVYGNYRNRYTDDPRVKHKVHSTANTHIIYFDKQLLALKEDSRPYAMDPDTLETKGLYDFNGQYKAPTHTAHPKVDPHTGELMTFGYEANGDSTTDVVYYLFDKNGKKLEEFWFNAPWASMMHDMAATDKWIVMIVPPLATVPVEMLEKGHHHFAWDESKRLMFGIFPRRNPKPGDVKWFHSDNAFFGHSGNAFDGDDGCVYMDSPLFYWNVFWFFPPIGESVATALSGKPPVGKIDCNYVRWRFDPNAADGRVEPKELLHLSGEMPKVDDRNLTKPYRILFLNMTDPSEEHAPVGPNFNAIAKCDVDTGKYVYWSAGKYAALHEVAFIPRNPTASEGDGFVISIVNRTKTMLTCIVILDTADIPAGPVAIIELPFRLRAGIHGSWVPAEALSDTADLCDMHGLSDETRQEFENKPVNFPAILLSSSGTNGLNGAHN